MSVTADTRQARAGCAGQARVALGTVGRLRGGFTDVTPAAFFCNNVEWMKNRRVTLGCTLTEYCPNDFVLRSQMAAFMNRLGVVTPTILRVTDASSPF